MEEDKSIIDTHFTGTSGIQFGNPMSSCFLEVSSIYDNEEMYEELNPNRTKAIILWILVYSLIVIEVLVSLAIGALLYYWIQTPLQGIASAFLSIQMIRIFPLITVDFFEEKIPSTSKMLTKWRKVTKVDGFIPLKHSIKDNYKKEGNGYKK